MNATSFQVPEGFVRPSPKHGEPWSRSPVVNAAQIRFPLLAGMVPPPAWMQYQPSVTTSELGWYRAIRRVLRLPTQMVPSFFQCVCELVHACARERVIVNPNDINTSGKGHNTSGHRAMPPLRNVRHLLLIADKSPARWLTSRLDASGVVY